MTPAKLWIDVDDLVQFLAHGHRPSGIQRVTFEICQALQQMDAGAGRVGFVRRAGGPCDLLTVDWATIDAAFRLVSNPVSATPAVRRSPDEPTPRRQVDLPPPIAGAESGTLLLNAVRLQARALGLLAISPVLVAAVLARRLRRRWQARRPIVRPAAETRGVQAAILEGSPLAKAAAPGDCFVVLGSPWIHRDYAQTVRWARDEQRMRFALLMYDLVPLRRPEWCDRAIVEAFVGWHRTVLPLADQVFAISRATADDVTAWAAEIGLKLPGAVVPVPMGTGLTHEQVDGWRNGPPPPADFPPPGSYVLFVSTLEARKNHALLFRVWRRLLAEMPAEQVPTLVFAGRVGWMVADLMQQLENADWLDGKIRLIRNPSDPELMALYRGCRFTLFPSLFEGWGLPVSESLALGRPCIASNRTSLPEAGGTLARYFDPEDLEDATAMIRAAILDPGGLEAWRDQVAKEFRMVPWADSAAVIRRTLDQLDVQPEPAAVLLPLAAQA